MSTSGAAGPDQELIAGRYRVERLLGQGGMGAVYAVLDVATGQPRALKRLLKDAGTRAGSLFEREFRTLSGLRHPRIVKVFDYGLDARGAFYTMELLAGADLSGKAPMPWREVCACLRDTASILGVLHARRLVHRDLSPKNLWRTPDGRITLIDFGALAPFGKANEMVGTPAFVAPEVLHGRPLDQRTDLYALGALAYWLLTSTHAYRAQNLAELPRLWEREPARPASLVKLLNGAVPELPAELDQLVSSLLKLDANERPTSTTDVIDALNTMAELPPELEQVVAQGYLESKSFVGRAREQERVSECLKRADTGQPQVLLIEGPEGIGRTRLLEELAMTAGIAGALVLATDASSSGRPYGAASALCRALLKALPEDARRAAAPHAAVLGQLSPELRAELRVKVLAPPLLEGHEERARKQSALAHWFLTLSKTHTLVLLVDDIHALDEESQAFLATLAHEGAGHRLLLLSAASTEATRTMTAALHSIRSAASRLRLVPLTSAETLQLMRSVFGEVTYLERLAARLHKLSQGNPRYCLILAQHLVHTGLARYADGTWSLPNELPETGLPSSLRAGLLAGIERLEPEARSLGRLLSIPDHGLLTAEMCGAISNLSLESTQHTLRQLVKQGILQEAELGFRFTHASLREALYSELASEDRRRCHLALGNVLARGALGNGLAELRASVHFLRAGEPARAQGLLLHAGHEYTRVAVETLGEAAPMFAEAVELLRASGCKDHTLVLPLTALAMAGYFVDRGYAVRYGAQAVEVLENTLHHRWARRLRPLLGATLSVLCALLVSGLLLRLRRHAPQLLHTGHCLVAAATALAGTAALGLDGKLVRRYADVLEPLTALGKRHAATMGYQLCVGFARCAEERPAGAQDMLGSTIAWLKSSLPIHALAPTFRPLFLAGASLPYGIHEVFKNNDSGRRTADELAHYGPQYAMYADHLRGCYYAGQGDLQRAQEFKQRVEIQAIQLGSAWQVETWAPTDAWGLAFWTQNAVTMKRAAEELTRLVVEVPSLRFHERCTHASYLVLRGKYREAIAMFEGKEEPLSTILWARARGILAAAHNQLGEHERAREVCSDVLARVTEADLAYVWLNLNVQIELSLAEVGLGNFEPARTRLDGLIARHSANEGPLIVGYLQRARAELALREQDYEACHRHLAEMDRHYRVTRISGLLELVERLRRELAQAERTDKDPATETLLGDDLHLMTRVQLMMTNTGTLGTERANKALQIAVELSGANSGFIVLPYGQGLAAHLGPEPAPDLSSWAEQRLSAAYAADETAAMDGDALLTDLSVRVEGSVRYCVTPLWTQLAVSELPVAALVLCFERGQVQLPPAEVLRSLAGYLTPVESGDDLHEESGPTRPSRARG